MLNKSAKVIWLASYPKSGNTWVRLFLSSLISGTQNLEINNPLLNHIISDRSIVDTVLGISTANLAENDYLKYRSLFYHKWLNQQSEIKELICKVHDACILNDLVLFPPDLTRGSVYIIRNPFDMVASLANYYKVTNDVAVKMLCNPHQKLATEKGKLNSQISQHLGTWENHLQSWEKIHHDNMLLVKYENLVHHELQEFSKIVRYMQLDYDMDAITNALKQTVFEKLQAKEKETKFKLATKVEKFFRQGKTGQWRNEITEAQAQRIIEVNYDTLLKYNYIDSKGNILV